ncbi:DUF5908 family protein [Algoriphagus marincola]|uniref:DUF5908 family protein n=1 Tax=Algoriphagus marincola TaxID=264027 RepID=UPI00040F3D30|nr:DUF5908 family protein [Algoriphagus marincola]
MPIEVKELIIRTTVDSADEKPTGKNRPLPRAEALEKGMEEIIRLIKDKNER